MQVFLGLGSNIGSRLETLQLALDLLSVEPGVRVQRSSRVWQTDPVDGPEQDDFLNVVIEIDTDLEPHDLLAACHRVEAQLGRTRKIHWGPRTIDIDILLIDDLTIADADLTVPHPRMHERAFVLLPLLELVPDPVLPNGIRLLDVRFPDQPAHLHASPLSIPT